jgi:subtilisin family serine protease
VIGLVALTTAAVAVPLAGALPASAQPAATGAIVNAAAPDTVNDSYIVVLKDTVSAQSVDAAVAGLAQRHGVTEVRYTYRSALSGFSATMSERQARQIAAEPAVAHVEQNRAVHASTEQVPTPSWGLDRIDAASLPLNSRYGYPDDGGSKVHAYVIDTGIRTSHGDFGGRATSGFDAVDGGTADDCNGHGTHVAGTIGGAAHGVAKSVKLVAVRVLGCDGGGTIAGVLHRAEPR